MIAVKLHQELLAESRKIAKINKDVRLTSKMKYRLEVVKLGLEFEPVTVEVKCSGSMHKIHLTRKGRLVLCSHTREELEANDVMIAFGKVLRCRCHTIKKHWIKAVKAASSARLSSLPDSLLKEMYRARLRNKVRRDRENRQIISWSHRLDTPFKERASVIAKCVKRALTKNLALQPMHSITHYKPSTLSIAVKPCFPNDKCKIKMMLPPIRQPVQNLMTFDGKMLRLLWNMSTVQGTGVVAPSWYNLVYKAMGGAVNGGLVMEIYLRPRTGTPIAHQRNLPIQHRYTARTAVQPYMTTGLPYGQKLEDLDPTIIEVWATIRIIGHSDAGAAVGFYIDSRIEKCVDGVWRMADSN